MTASTLVPIGVLLSVLLSFGVLLGGAVWARNRPAHQRTRALWGAVAIGFLLNSWWLWIVGAIFVKFVILKEGT